MPVDKKAILMKALADIKGLARGMKGQGLMDKYGPKPEPDEGTPDEEAMDATEGDPTDTDMPPDDAPPDDSGDDVPPDETMDDDKIAALVAMLGKK